MSTTPVNEQDIFSELTIEDWQVLVHRAQVLAHAAVDKDADQSETLHILTLKMASESYAVKVEHVRLVQPLKRLTRVPWVPNFVIGVLNLRGKVISLIDLRKFFGIAGQEITDMLQLIVVEAAGLELAIAANRVSEVSLMPRSHFVTPPATVNGIDAECIEGVTAEGLILLNLEAILGDPRMMIDETKM